MSRKQPRTKAAHAASTDTVPAPVATLGRKFDAGKPRFSLFPIETLNPILQVLEYGAKKYDEGNWRHVPDARRRYADALHRHYVEYLSGIVIDPESGLPTLACMVTDGIFLLAFDIADRTS